METALRGQIVVFAGPSLPLERRPHDPGFTWCPPAVAGDAWGLSGRSPRAVVLIDGLFDDSPAIRHNELLVLIAQGIPLIGAASMGALRAAELHSLGMIGVGRIFAAFAGGRLEGDDEVALLHGPADWDWVPLTTPLVNVRATLWEAVRQRVIGGADARAILRLAQATFYKRRTWPALLEALQAQGTLAAERCERFGNWLARGAVDLKQADALAALDHARIVGTQPPRPMPPDTLFAQELRRSVSERSGRPGAVLQNSTPKTKPEF